ncbi:MAG: molybdopterin molybdotransferase MoeA [Bacteroidales bacterium]|nr:molybdopterin molybdotransferase MoeA [Bacteroidales bacterium]MCF8405902.1 molybdopterin molybdotransferase MoeA [Bacteroidales bacterium]
MIKFEEALKLVNSVNFSLATVRVDINQSLGHVLAEDVFSDIQMPPFNKSAVDGYACRNSDLKNTLEVIEVIPAGVSPTKSVGPNQCSKIMTGAPVPIGADSVIMVEDVEEISEKKIRYLKDDVKDNICYIGEDLKEGEKVLEKGTPIQPQHIAVMATAGAVSPLVYKKVRVAVISTGDELVEPHFKPASSQIRNSNAYQLVAQVNKIGAIPEYIGIAKDTEESTREMLLKAFENNDVVLLTGGVSMGDYDYVPQVLNEMGIKLQFKSIAVQPGRPTVFGIKNNQFIFGLPGNPVSSFVQFELLVKPLIYRLSGYAFKPPKIGLPMGVDYRRKKSGRLSWLPVEINAKGEVIPLEYHGSAHINALVNARGLIAIPVGETELKKGTIVDVRQI